MNNRNHDQKKVKRKILDFAGKIDLFVSIGGELPNRSRRFKSKYVESVSFSDTCQIFRIPNIEKYPENRVRIYDQDKELVFLIKGYNNKDKVFKGLSYGISKAEDNIKLKEGVYSFYIDYRASKAFKTVSGFLIINN